MLTGVPGGIPSSFYSPGFIAPGLYSPGASPGLYSSSGGGGGSTYSSSEPGFIDKVIYAADRAIAGHQYVEALKKLPPTYNYLDGIKDVPQFAPDPVLNIDRVWNNVDKAEARLEATRQRAVNAANAKK